MPWIYLLHYLSAQSKLFHCLLSICISSLQKFIFKSFVIFSFVFIRVLYIFRMQVSCNIHVLYTLPHSLGYLFSFLLASFEAHRILLLFLWHLIHCFFCCSCLVNPYLSWFSCFVGKWSQFALLCVDASSGIPFVPLTLQLCRQQSLPFLSLAMSWEHLHLGTIVFLWLL